MRILVVGLSAALLSLSTSSTETSAQAEKCSNQVFCSGWRGTCHRTLPAGGNPKVCTERYQACLSSGCYFFNKPRPRCKNNPEDYKLSYSCHAQRPS